MTISDKLLLKIVTFGYSGLISKKMPGTVGSIAAIILCYLLPTNTTLFYILFCILFVIGTIASQEYVTRYPENKDPGFIVIDEAAAIFLGNAILLQVISSQSIQYNHIIYLVNFVIFRFFDILKPYPIRQIERFYKKLPKFLGFGIMIDDVLAALYTSIISHFCIKLFL